jgi:hypothetical protein
LFENPLSGLCRRRRLDRPGRPLAVAGNAGAWRNSCERGVDRKSDRCRKKLTVDIQPGVAKGGFRPVEIRYAMARMRK